MPERNAVRSACNCFRAVSKGSVVSIVSARRRIGIGRPASCASSVCGLILLKTRPRCVRGEGVLPAAGSVAKSRRLQVLGRAVVIKGGAEADGSVRGWEGCFPVPHGVLTACGVADHGVVRAQHRRNPDGDVCSARLRRIFGPVKQECSSYQILIPRTQQCISPDRLRKFALLRLIRKQLRAGRGEQCKSAPRQRPPRRSAPPWQRRGSRIQGSPRLFRWR